MEETNMRKNTTQMSEDDFRTFLKTTKEGKLLKEIAMKSYRESQQKKILKKQMREILE